MWSDLHLNWLFYSWIEHDSDEIWQGVQECLEGAIKATRKKVGDIKIKAFGITNQRETTLVWDKSTGQALCKAIVWMDTRTQQICTEMTEQLGSKACLVLMLVNICDCQSNHDIF